MRPIFRAELVNKTFGDPGVYIDLKFLRRALLFDIGDVTSLSTRKLLRISDIFVSHTHMDHFAGFDHFLRVCLGRDLGVRIYGPVNFMVQLEHKLAAYTWNLVENYATDFVITAHEFDGVGRVRRAQFRSKNRFQCEPLDDVDASDGVLRAEEQFRVRARAFDHHGVPSLAFSFEEGVHINVWKNRLKEMRLPTGPWLTQLKRLAREGAPDDTPIAVRWRTREGSQEETFSLGVLRERVLEFTSGQRVCYVTDVAGHRENTEALVEFLHGADIAFIEAVFLHADREHAVKRAHLTATQSGEIAHRAGVKSATPFHFSPRYMGQEDVLRSEFEASWRGQRQAQEARDV